MVRKLQQKFWRFYWYLKKVSVPYSPSLINIEVTDVCNLNCLFCSFDNSRPKGFMDEKLFRSIIDEASRWGIKIVRPFLAGEPLLHKELPQLIKYAKTKNMKVELYTNATVLTPRISEELIDAELDFINFSFNGGEDKESYERGTGGANYETTLNNVISFLKLKKEKHRQKPFVCLSVLKEFSEKNRNLKVSKEFRNKFENLPLDLLIESYPNNHIGEKSDFGCKPPGNFYFPCKELWFTMNVLWDGRVVACCYDLNGRLIIGDAKKNSLKEIWNSQEMMNLRKKLINREYKDIRTCRNCNQLWPYFHPIYREVTLLPFFKFFYEWLWSPFLFRYSSIKRKLNKKDK